MSLKSIMYLLNFATNIGLKLFTKNLGTFIQALLVGANQGNPNFSSNNNAVINNSIITHNRVFIQFRYSNFIMFENILKIFKC